MSKSKAIFDRLLAVGLVAMCMALLWFGAVEPLASYYADKREAVRDARALLARYKTVADYGEQVAKFVSTTEARNDLTAFMSGPSEAITVANLQSKLKTIATSSGAMFRSATSLPTKDVDGLKLAGVQVALAGPLPSIHKTIHSIETGKPFLFILRAQLLPARHFSGNRDRKPVEINAQLDIYGALTTTEESK